METSNRRSYTKEQRAAAVADVPGLGVNKAAKKHGVPQTCVSRWAAAAGVGRKPKAKATRRPKAKATRRPKAKTARRPKVKTARRPKVKTARRPKVKTARMSKAGARPGGEPKEVPADESKHKEPAAATVPVTAEPAVRRTLKTRVAKLYTPSQKAVILEDAAKDGITAAAEKHDVSRYSIYDWQRKVAKAAEGKGESPTSGPSECEIAEQRDKEILDEWHRHPGLGPSQIRNQLRRKGIKVSVNTARRVMEEAGYRPPKVERKPHEQRYECVFRRDSGSRSGLTWAAVPTALGQPFR